MHRSIRGRGKRPSPQALAEKEAAEKPPTLPQSSFFIAHAPWNGLQSGFCTLFSSSAPEPWRHVRNGGGSIRALEPHRHPHKVGKLQLRCGFFVFLAQGKQASPQRSVATVAMVGDGAWTTDCCASINDGCWSFSAGFAINSPE